MTNLVWKLSNFYYRRSLKLAQWVLVCLKWFVCLCHVRQYLVVVFRDKPLELWDIRTGTLLREMAKNFPVVTALVKDQSQVVKLCPYRQQVARPCCKMCFSASHTHTHTHCLMSSRLFHRVFLSFYVALFWEIRKCLADSAKNINLCWARRVLINEELCWKENWQAVKSSTVQIKSLIVHSGPLNPKTAVKFPYLLQS